MRQECFAGLYGKHARNDDFLAEVFLIASYFQLHCDRTENQVCQNTGLLALEEKANQQEDPFFKQSIMLIVDATDPEKVKTLFFLILFSHCFFPFTLFKEGNQLFLHKFRRFAGLYGKHARNDDFLAEVFLVASYFLLPAAFPCGRNGRTGGFRKTQLFGGRGRGRAPCRGVGD